MPIILVLLWLTVAAGWVLNIFQVASLAIANADMGTLFILKIVGIPLGPLGCVLGWIGI